MASEAADHMSCPLHAWYCICWLACAAACTQDDRTGACGGARPVFEHHAVMKLSPTQWLIMYTYVQCRDGCVCVHCLSNAVFVFKFGVVTAACFLKSIFFLKSCFSRSFNLPHSKSLHDESITRFDVIRISQQLCTDHGEIQRWDCGHHAGAPHHPDSEVTSSQPHQGDILFEILYLDRHISLSICKTYNASLSFTTSSVSPLNRTPYFSTFTRTDSPPG